MANKKTKRDYFEELREVVGDNQELCDFIDHELDLLARKSNAKMTKVNEEHQMLMATLLECLANAEQPMTITELQKDNMEQIGDYSNQKLSAIMKKLVDSHQVVKTIDKKKSYFSLPTE